MREAFEELDEEGKARAVREYAGVVYQLSQLRFNRIGSLRRKPNGNYYVGGSAMVRSNHADRMNEHIHKRLDRSFSSIVPWLLAVEKDERLFVQRHPERVNEWSTLFGKKTLEEVVDIVSSVMTNVVKAIPKACDTGPLSRVLCLWHYDLNCGNILISTSPPDAGKIVGVIDWDGAIVTPIWRVVRWPDFISFSGGRYFRSDPDAKVLKNILRDELLRLDRDGLLRRSFQPRYELSRDLVEVVTLPWNCTHERRQWLDAFEKQREGARVTVWEWALKALATIRTRGRRQI